MNARKFSAILFRIVYNSSYTVLFGFLLVALAVTPADHIYQTRRNHKLGNVFVVGGTYLVTGILALFIYSSRLYTNRAALAAIPKSYLPIEKGEVSKKVHKMIVKNRQRSALIAWESRPKVLQHDARSNDENQQASEKRRSTWRGKSHSKVNIMTISSKSPPWGDVAHPGWSSPATLDLPNLQFDTVVAELPNLIEAKAVSLAPRESSLDFISPLQDSRQSPPDPKIVAHLQRPSKMGLRDYLERLDGLGVFDPPSLAGNFLRRYEYARFSTYAMSENEFRDLMAAFSDLLVGMQEPTPETLTRSRSGSFLSVNSNGNASQSPIGHGKGLRFGRRSSEASSLSSSQSVLRHSLIEESLRPP